MKLLIPKTNDIWSNEAYTSFSIIDTAKDLISRDNIIQNPNVDVSTYFFSNILMKSEFYRSVRDWSWKLIKRG